MIVRVDHTGTLVKPVEQVTVLKLASSGPQGPSGTTLTGRGAWTAGAYAKDEFVSYGGASYVANTATTSGDTPGVSSKWTLLASKGDTGSTGSTGSTGATGAQGSSGVVSVSAPITNSGTSGSAALALTTNVANGVPLLTVDGLIDSSQLPAIAISDTSVVGSQAAMLALTAQVGDIAVRTDTNQSYILKTAGASTLANWQVLLTPPDTVTSVASKTGNVTLANTDISGLGTASTKDVPAAGNASSSQVVYGTDTRLTDTRTPADDSVTSAKIVDGTIVNADVNASAGIVDTKLNLSAATTSGVTPSSSAKIVSASTTVSGTAISSTNKVVDAAAALTERSNGMLLYPWGNGVAAFTSPFCRWQRFVPTRNLTVLRFGFEIRTASTNAESVDIGLYDSGGNRLISSGATTTIYSGPTNTSATATTSAGYKYIVLNGATGYTLTAGSTYYAGIGITYTSGTSVTIAVNSYYMAGIFGSTAGVGENASQSATSTLPATMASVTYSGTVGPMIALIT